MNNTTTSWIDDNVRGLEKFRIFLKTVTTIFLLLSVVMIITMIFTADEVYESDMDHGEGMGAQDQWEDRDVADLDGEEEEESEESDGEEDEEDQENGQVLGSDGGDETDYGTDSSNE